MFALLLLVDISADNCTQRRGVVSTKVEWASEYVLAFAHVCERILVLSGAG
jgi:hypothetical protein